MATIAKKIPKGITIEEYQHIETYGVEVPSFPVFMLFVALLKDGLFDILSFGLLEWLGSLLLGAILFFWVLGKVSFVQKRLMKYFIRWYLAALVVGIIPFLNFLPEATLLVVLVHYRETKIVRALLAVLERDVGALRA